MINGTAYPLTSETLNEMLASPDAFQGLTTGVGKNLSLFGLLDPSNSMNQYSDGASREGTTYSERPAIKLASFIEKVSSINHKDVDKILAYVHSTPEVLNQYVQNGTYEVVEKLASLDTTTEESFAQSILRGVDINRHMVYEDSRGNTFIKQANSEVDYVWDVPVTYSDIASMDKYATAAHPEDAPTSRSYSNSYNVIGTDANTLVVNEDQDWTSFDKYAELSSVPHNEAIDEGLATKTPQVGDYGMFKLGNDVTEPGEIIDISSDTDITPTNAYKVFGRNDILYVDKNSSYETKVASSDKVFSTFDLEGSEPMLGDTGTFIIGDKALNPFEIVSLQKTASVGNYEVVGYDGLQKISYYPIKTTDTRPIPHDTIKNAYYIPGNAKFVKLSGGKMHRDVASNIEKTANFSPVSIKVKNEVGDVKTYYPTESGSRVIQEHIYEKNAYYLPESIDFVPLHEKFEVEYGQTFEKVSHYAGRDNSGLYYLQGPEFDKYASNGHATRNLSKVDASWAAVHCGVSAPELEKLSSLNSGEVTALRSNVSSPKNIENVGNEITAKFEKISKEVPVLKQFLVKEASVLEDKTTVDAVLALGLLNQENLMDYIQLAPNLEKTASDLAKTLITVRMGLSHIPEEPVKTAMHSLARVSRVLRELETVVSETK